MQMSESGQDGQVTIQMYDITKNNNANDTGSGDITDEHITDKHITDEHITDEHIREKLNSQDSSVFSNTPRHSNVTNSLTSSKRKMFFQQPGKIYTILLMLAFLLLFLGVIVLTVLALTRNLYPHNSGTHRVSRNHNSAVTTN